MVRSWAKLGAWAEETERAEAEAAAAAAVASAAAPALVPAESFPSLGEAVAQRPKKKKGQTLTISELTIGKYVGPGGKGRTSVMSDSRGLTSEEMMVLPTGPRERSEEEQQRYGGLGGGFRDYGGYRGGGNDRDRERGGFRGDRDGDIGYGRDRDERIEMPSRADDSSNWGDSKVAITSSRGMEDRRRYDDRRSDRDLPSRADETNDWGAGKKFSSGGVDDYDDRRRDRLSDRDLPSRADEVDNWGADKKFVPSERLERRSFNSMNSDDRRNDGIVSKADSDQNWGAHKKFTPADTHRREGSEFKPSERRRLSLQPRTLDLSVDATAECTEGDSKPVKTSPFGSARPREQVLEEKGHDLRKIDVEGMLSPVTSSHSSRPATPDASLSKPRHKINPFGNAKPREVLLQERGVDWRKIDFELERKSVSREETEEERKLREDIRLLEEVVKDMSVSESENVKEELGVKEKELVRITRELDDRIRYSHRPVSMSGRSSERGGNQMWNADRPPSRRGTADLLRPRSAAASDGGYSSGWPGSRDFNDRPLSRDSGYHRSPDIWTADNNRPSSRGGWSGRRPPSRSRDDVGYNNHHPYEGGGGGGGGGGADIWRRDEREMKGGYEQIHQQNQHQHDYQYQQQQQQLQHHQRHYGRSDERW